MTAFVTGRWGRLGWRLRLVLVAISLPHAALAADHVADRGHKDVADKRVDDFPEGTPAGAAEP